jgi:hypothetical protein
MKALHVLLIALLLASAGTYSLAQDGSLAELRRRADNSSGAECSQLSMQAAHQALEDANRYFGAGDVKAAQAAVEGSVLYATRSVDCSLHVRKGEKAVEIDLRKLIRRTKDVLQTVDSEDRQQLARSLIELEKQRDRLLRAMFGAAAGGAPEKKP